MLELKNIKKTYKIGDIETKALDDISIRFREKEFVAILGTSGSGKTTCLNIIGGLDRYDSGDLVINGKSTKDFKARDWDAYRNNSVGFVFQNYNLISHISIVANVEMGMTLSGVSSSKKRKRAVEVLEQVGLKEHLHKKPNQLSGGQMQRVAIARALANNPDILLCDEPTGALDTSTSVQILDLIKEVAKERLVIMVTHNPDLAEKYSDRIIRFQDGKVIADSNPYQDELKQTQFSLKKTSMSFLTALKLSANNVRTKLGRTFLTSFASSIGIIGIALILSLSVGFKIQIDDFQRNALSEFPIMISQQSAQLDMESISTMQGGSSEEDEYPDTNSAYLYNPEESTIMHKNVFNEEYVEYINGIDEEICKSIGYYRTLKMNLLRDDSGTISPVSTDNLMTSYPAVLNEELSYYLKENYDLLSGDFPQNETDLVLVLDSKNRISIDTMKELGFSSDDLDSIPFDQIVGTQLKVVMNNDYYLPTPYGIYTLNTDYAGMYHDENNLTLTIKGIIRQKEESTFAVVPEGIAYSDELALEIIEDGRVSDVVTAQKEKDYNILTMEAADEEAKSQIITYLGGDALPYMITMYPSDFDNKEAVLDYLDDYNEGKDKESQIIYTDMADMITGLTGSIIDGITYVLIAFAATSLFVSLIMIGIITYTSVLERTKEIGILKALGARKKDITRVFDAETFILGIFSGTLGVVIAWLLTFPVNSLIYNLTELENVARLQLSHAVALVIISTVLTMLGGHLPARMASKKDAVEALRSE